MTVACIGDIHLGALDRYIPKAYLRVLDTIDKIVDNCVSKGIDNIVLLGDVSDTPQLPDHILIKLLDLFKKYDVAWHIPVGNHDRASEKEHALRLIDWMGKSGLLNVRVYNKPEIVKIDDDRYFMCPSPYVEDVPKKCRYGFGHFGFSGAMSDSGIRLKTKNAPNGRWILGDYHTPQFGKTYMYAGSVAQVKFYESPEKGYIELEDEPKFISWKPSILLGRESLTSLEDFERLDTNTYYMVTFSGKVDLPPNWTTKYPNIVRITSEKPVSKKARVLLKSIKTTDVLANLDSWLANKGLTDKEIRLARRLLK